MLTTVLDWISVVLVSDVLLIAVVPESDVLLIVVMLESDVLLIAVTPESDVLLIAVAPESDVLLIAVILDSDVLPTAVVPDSDVLPLADVVEARVLLSMPEVLELSVGLIVLLALTELPPEIGVLVLDITLPVLVPIELLAVRGADVVLSVVAGLIEVVPGRLLFTMKK